MYKKEMLGNNNKEHLFSPPLSFAPPHSCGGLFFCEERSRCCFEKAGFSRRFPLK